MEWPPFVSHLVSWEPCESHVGAHLGPLASPRGSTAARPTRDTLRAHRRAFRNQRAGGGIRLRLVALQGRGPKLANPVGRLNSLRSPACNVILPICIRQLLHAFSCLAAKNAVATHMPACSNSQSHTPQRLQKRRRPAAAATTDRRHGPEHSFVLRAGTATHPPTHPSGTPGLPQVQLHSRSQQKSTLLNGHSRTTTTKPAVTGECR